MLKITGTSISTLQMRHNILIMFMLVRFHPVIFSVGMECADDRLQMFNSSCYLFVSYPEVTWQTAQHICQGMKVHNNFCDPV